VSVQLAQDTSFPFERWLPWVLARRIGRGLNPHLSAGTGAGAQPVGLFNNATVGVTGGAGTGLTIVYDSVVDLIASVDPEYLEPLDEAAPFGPDQGFIGFMGSKAALQMLRKVKDTAGAPIVTEGIPPKVLGYDYLVNPDAPAPAINAKSLAFGNFGAGYLVRRVVGDVIVIRLQELYQENLQLGWLAFARYDGTPADAGAVKLYQNGAS
jgi:HK97 family phage major capsid protein